MDQIGKSLNNLSLWEVKSYVRKAQNAVLNLTEMEAKVREATNNEPWGASSTLMATIARGTFNYRDREEICNMIFRRFTEKAANEWRQIYKALVLMEYLVKNGSERFVDDARANVGLVGMLKSFHYVDHKGVDQGINVRNRARELSALLSDEAKIRAERKKAKENSKKFGAVSSSSGGYTANVSSGRGNDGYENRVFGDGGVYGQRFEENRTHVANDDFEEYDVGTSSGNGVGTATVAMTTVNANATVGAAADDDDDDEFDDFQSATPAAEDAGAPKDDLMDLLGSAYSQPTATNPSTITAPPAPNPWSSTVSASGTSGWNAPVQTQAPNINQPKNDIFGDLLLSAKSTPATKPTPTITSAPAPAPAPVSRPAPPASTATKQNDILNLLDL